MITKELMDYLSDNNVSINKKYMLIESLNLNYSDLFELKEMFRHDAKLYRMIHSFICYQDDNFNGKIDYKDRKQGNKKKERKMKFMRRYKNDKHKRK